jgi:hypothetical protein
MGLIKSYAERIIAVITGEILFALLLFAMVGWLAFGTNALVALGIPRNIAGSFTVLVVVIASVYGLYLFATRVIDW